MKRTIITGLLALIAIAFITTSCEEAEEKLNNKMFATIDGEKWTSQFRATVQKNDAFTITATNKPSEDEGKQLALTIRGTSEGTYELSASEVSGECAAVYRPQASDQDTKSYVSKSGTVELTKVDKENTKISGTFEFKMTKVTSDEDVIEITDGEFNDLNYK